MLNQTSYVIMNDPFYQWTVYQTRTNSCRQDIHLLLKFKEFQTSVGEEKTFLQLQSLPHWGQRGHLAMSPDPPASAFG